MLHNVGNMKTCHRDPVIRMECLEMIGTRAIREDMPDSKTNERIDMEGVDSAWMEGCALETDIEAVSVNHRYSNFLESRFWEKLGFRVYRSREVRRRIREINDGVRERLKNDNTNEVARRVPTG